MIELIKIALDTIAGVVAQWINAPNEERVVLEKRVIDGLSVMRGERQAAHEEIDARTEETRRVIAEEKAKLDKADEETKP